MPFESDYQILKADNYPNFQS